MLYGYVAFSKMQHSLELKAAYLSLHLKILNSRLCIIASNIYAYVFALKFSATQMFGFLYFFDKFFFLYASNALNTSVCQYGLQLLNSEFTQILRFQFFSSNRKLDGTDFRILCIDSFAHTFTGHSCRKRLRDVSFDWINVIADFLFSRTQRCLVRTICSQCFFDFALGALVFFGHTRSNIVNHLGTHYVAIETADSDEIEKKKQAGM